MVNQTGNRSQLRIAVAGATGRVGRALVARLAKDPVQVVALSRNASSIATSASVQAAEADFDKPSTLLEAMQGADRLFLAHGTSDRQVANEIALIDAAVTAGVSHIVKLSAMGPPTRLHPFDWHMQIEANLAGREIGYTVLRPSSFVDTLNRAKAPVAEATWGGAAGDGLVNLIDSRDVAEVARVALLDELFLSSQRAYHLTGPACVTMPQVAEELSKLLDRPVTYQHRTRAEQRALLIASGSSEMVTDLLLGLDRIFREGVLAETTTTVSDLLGRPARSVVQWLTDNLNGFMK
ncbi:NAD(P)H-binding protein [Novosphingobium sp.]|uniref:NAD(P)H-binding protein n=1 Tax=Novosphingobium sp. TaxID=1874826 RepID=UPI003D6D519E